MERLEHRNPQITLHIESELEKLVRLIGHGGMVEHDNDELNARMEAMRSGIHARKRPPFDPQTNASDRELHAALEASQQRLCWLANRRDVLESRRVNALEQTARLPAPRRSLAVFVAVATCVFAIGFGPTIYSVFLTGVADSLLAWVIAMGIGAAVGGFLSLLLLNFEEEEQVNER